MKRRNFLKMGMAAGVGLMLPRSVYAQTPPPPIDKSPRNLLQHKVTVAERRAAAKRAVASGFKPGVAGAGVNAAAVDNSKGPHYYGPYANYANSPLPRGPVASLELVEGGSGYTVPVVEISDVYGTGTGATATATVVGGVITALTLTNAGSNYSAPFVTITDPATTAEGAEAAAVIGGTFAAGTGIRKFVDSLAGLGAAKANTLGQYIPVAVADPNAYPGPTGPGSVSDYYEIAVVEFKQQLHRDLPPTRLRGYVQIETAAVTGAHYPLTYPDGSPILNLAGQPVYAVDQPRYLGPIIVCKRDIPVRVKFTNYLPKGSGGDLFIPVDTTVMGAGMGALMHEAMPMNYTQNRATIHLHGIKAPWISDGTPHQWVTPAGEMTSYPKGVSVQNVPDMPDPGEGSMTFYYNNQQSARLMFYHDHSHGITRLNVYAGEAAGYLLTDAVEEDMINGSNATGVNLPTPVKVLPDYGIPLILQDKTFVDAATIAAQDPTWKWNLDDLGNPVTGSLWVPNVYMPGQNPWDPSGANAYGRWQYGPWFWPPTDIKFPPIPNPYYGDYPWEPPVIPAMPTPSMGMEAYNDTTMVNGSVYPYLEVEPTVVRFRILNAANDRFFNLHFYIADPDTVTADGRTNTEVKMVPAIKTPGFPASWPSDAREGGVPDPATVGPSWIQIGTEGGFLPEPVVIPPQPLAWNMNATAFNVGNVSDHSLLLGCAERADVLVDFSEYPGQTLILYNDAPAAFPALDPRYDYYTGNPDQTSSGGTPPTQPGYGPNIRTVMQIRVKAVDGVVGAGVDNVTLTAGGSDYSFAPDVMFLGGSGTGAAATATCSLDHVTILNTGSGYTSAAVEITGGGGTGAAATAVLTGDRVTGLVITNIGAGYTTAPTVTITGDGSGATGVAALTVTAVAMTAPGSGYLFAPTVKFVGGGGYGVSAMSKLIRTGIPYNLDQLKQVFAKTDTKHGVFEVSQEPIIIPQPGYNSAYNASYPADNSVFVQQHDFSKTFFNGPLTALAVTAGGTGYTTAPTIEITGGGGTGALAEAGITGATVNAITVTNRGSGYTSAPTVTLNGGTGAGARATAVLTRIVASVTVTNGGSGYTSAPTVVFSGGGGSGAAATATVSGGRVTGITVTNGGSGYTSTPSVSFSGGGGSNARATAVMTRVVNSVVVVDGGAGYAVTPAPTVEFTGGGGTGAAAEASVLPGFVSSITLTNQGSGYTSAPTIAFTGGGGADAAAAAEGITLNIEPKALQDEMGEAYDTEYGRMGGFIGLELPVTNSKNQNFVLYGYSSPPVDLMQNSMTPLGTLDDGTQIWKITHNGVDTHPMHFHLFNVQVINRVAWDGALMPPEPNELGWKETVRTNPLEHVIVAMRPVAPTQPFDVPNSIRMIDPHMPAGEPLMESPLGWIDPIGEPAPVLNHEVNYGWEYVWHCHILSHEEMDMMHSLAFGMAPNAPSNLAATYNNSQRRVRLTWTDNSANETGFVVERATSATGPWTALNTRAPASPGTGLTVVYIDSSVQRNRTYFYRVMATNVIGDTTVYPAPAIGYPTKAINSEPTNPGISIVTSANPEPGVPFTSIFASSFEEGLAEWSGTAGNVQAIAQAVLDPGAGPLGLAAVMGDAGALVQGANLLVAQPAYVYDDTPDNETLYDASFYFHPNGAVSGDEPVDIFVGLDQNELPIFGVQYHHDDDESEVYEVRGWALFNGEPVYTNPVAITNAAQLIEVAWQSNVKAGFTLYVADKLAKTINGDTSAHTMNMAILGPSMNLNENTSGTMYFDDFSSSRINGIQATWLNFLPFLGK